MVSTIIRSCLFFWKLEIPEPDYYLNIGSGNHSAQTGKMRAKIEEVLIQEKPDLVIVLGGTNSIVGGALAAVTLYIPVAHVESGLRSFDRSLHEEVNHVVTDHISDLLSCPRQTSVDNLAKEGITHCVHLVGDVIVDAFVYIIGR